MILERGWCFSGVDTDPEAYFSLQVPIWRVVSSIWYSVSMFESGGNADYGMDMHQKEQLHDNAVSMMQAQHFSVSPFSSILHE